MLRFLFNNSYFNFEKPNCVGWHLPWVLINVDEFSGSVKSKASGQLIINMFRPNVDNEKFLHLYGSGPALWVVAVFDLLRKSVQLGGYSSCAWPYSCEQISYDQKRADFRPATWCGWWATCLRCVAMPVIDGSHDRCVWGQFWTLYAYHQLSTGKPIHADNIVVCAQPWGQLVDVDTQTAEVSTNLNCCGSYVTISDAYNLLWWEKFRRLEVGILQKWHLQWRKFCILKQTVRPMFWSSM